MAFTLGRRAVGWLCVDASCTAARVSCALASEPRSCPRSFARPAPAPICAHVSLCGQIAGCLALQARSHGHRVRPSPEGHRWSGPGPEGWAHVPSGAAVKKHAVSFGFRLVAELVDVTWSCSSSAGYHQPSENAEVQRHEEKFLSSKSLAVGTRRY